MVLQLGREGRRGEDQPCFPVSIRSPCTPAFFSPPPSPILCSFLKQQRETGKVNCISSRTLSVEEFEVFDLPKVFWGRMWTLPHGRGDIVRAPPLADTGILWTLALNHNRDGEGSWGSWTLWTIIIPLRKNLCPLYPETEIPIVANI